jgi:hypothetical protein
MPKLWLESRLIRRAGTKRSTEDHVCMNAVSKLLRCLALPGLLALLSAPVSADDSTSQRNVEVSPDGVPQRLILALDGIPYDVFVESQHQGLFAEFRPVSRMVSTFPSLTDVSFAAIGGGQIPTGYQQMHFDPVRNKTVGNTVGSLADRVHTNIYADSRDYSSMHRMIGYMAAYHYALRDLRDIGNEVLSSHKQTFVAYLEQSDPLVHIEGRPGAERFLRQLDGFLQNLQAQVRARTGRDLMIDIVSDHGSTMMKGRIVPVGQWLQRCGFQRHKRMSQPNSVAYSLAGIIGSVAITTSKQHTEDVARCLAGADGVDLVAVDRGDAVGVLTADGEAEVRLVNTAPEQYDYRALRGDPLGLLQDETATREQRFDQAQIFQQTRDASRPNPLRRLWRAFHGEVKEPSPIVVSLLDGREAGNTQLRAMALMRGRVGTHGSMTRLSSLGIYASNWRDVGDVDSWGAHDGLFGADTLIAMHRVLSERAAQVRPPSSPATQAGR